jgi:hypothetical protein
VNILLYGSKKKVEGATKPQPPLSNLAGRFPGKKIEAIRRVTATVVIAALLLQVQALISSLL